MSKGIIIILPSVLNKGALEIENFIFRAYGFKQNLMCLTPHGKITASEVRATLHKQREIADYILCSWSVFTDLDISSRKLVLMSLSEDHLVIELDDHGNCRFYGDMSAPPMALLNFLKETSYKRIKSRRHERPDQKREFVCEYTTKEEKPKPTIRVKPSLYAKLGIVTK